jgi:hypothetical protein
MSQATTMRPRAEQRPVDMPSVQLATPHPRRRAEADSADDRRGAASRFRLARRLFAPGRSHRGRRFGLDAPISLEREIGPAVGPIADRISPAWIPGSALIAPQARAAPTRMSAWGRPSPAPGEQFPRGVDQSSTEVAAMIGRGDGAAKFFLHGRLHIC